MNVPFILSDSALDKAFLAEADAAGLRNLKGHRSVGGMRASLYNAMPIEGVAALIEYMREFERANGTLTYDLKLGVHGEPIAESHMHMNIRGRSREDRARFDDQEAACAADVRRVIEETGWRLDSRRRNAR